jgi:tRNA(Ile)-lysidine synthase
MKDAILPPPGVYVVAVSGGIDSRALLHLLSEHNKTHAKWQLTVAHLDHGMRPDSNADRQFVEKLAKNEGLEFVYKRINLGASTNEARARKERYTFLHDVRNKINARSIITAHHQDDVLETAIINMLRGSGRRGLSSLSSRPDVLRPLLLVSKGQILTYAKANQLTWREDSTNQDDHYLRNYVRIHILPRFSEADRRQLLNIVTRVGVLNLALDDLLRQGIKKHGKSKTIMRSWFNNLPHAVAKETLATWLRDQHITDFDKKIIERLVVHAKAGRPGQLFPVKDRYYLKIEKGFLALAQAER